MPLTPSVLVVLLVAVPLGFAPLCMLLNRPRIGWLLSTLAAVICTCIAVVLAAGLADGGTVLHYFGGWAPPWGIAYRLDAVNAPLCVLIGLYTTAVLCWGLPSLTRELAADRQGIFHVCLLLNLAGMLGVACTDDIFNMFVFIEITSLSAYALVALGPDQRSLPAAFRYLLMGSVAASCILTGIGYLFALTGTLNMSDMRVRLSDVQHTRTAVMAFAFFTVGLGLKFAIFPLHGWLPAVYTRAPSVVAALFAALATKVYLYAWLRVSIQLFDTGLLFDELHLQVVLSVLAGAAVLFGSLAALVQSDLKSMLAYSSIAQMGYMVLGFSLITYSGLEAGFLYMFNHALIKCTLFLAAGNLVLRTGTARLADLAGLGHAMPWTATILSIAGLGLVGIPPTAGLVSKWYLAGALLEAGQWPAVLVLLIGSGLAAMYVWKLLRVLWLESPRGHTVVEAPLGMLLVPLLMTVAIIGFGLYSRFPLAWAGRAARALLVPS